MKFLRTAAGVFIFGTFTVVGSAVALVPGARLRRTLRLKNNRGLSKLLARAIDLKIKTHRHPLVNSRGRLILANHLSVLDAIAFAAVEDAVFVTSRDLAESKVIHWLATIGGAIFIERRNRSRRQEELDGLAALLAEGRTVILFPEATSTNGEAILRFRNGLLGAAFRSAEAEVIPVCLQYLTIGGDAVTRTNRDRVFLYGEMSVGAHLARIFSNPRVELSIRYFQPLTVQDFWDPPSLAAHAESLVRSVYCPIGPAPILLGHGTSPSEAPRFA